MPKSVAQLAGMIVTLIIGLGTDMDTAYSIPLGAFAGAVAMFFVYVSEADDAYRRRWEQTGR